MCVCVCAGGAGVHHSEVDSSIEDLVCVVFLAVFLVSRIVPATIFVTP